MPSTFKSKCNMQNCKVLYGKSGDSREGISKKKSKVVKIEFEWVWTCWNEFERVWTSLNEFQRVWTNFNECSKRPLFIFWCPKNKVSKGFFYKKKGCFSVSFSMYHSALLKISFVTKCISEKKVGKIWLYSWCNMTYINIAKV